MLCSAFLLAACSVSIRNLQLQNGKTITSCCQTTKKEVDKMKTVLLKPLTQLLLVFSFMFLSDSAYPAWTITEIGTLGGTGSIANGINNSGQVVGRANTTGNAAAHAFLWSNGLMQDLGTLGGYSEATSINNEGKVVGTSSYADQSATHAFLWNNGVIQDLGTLPGMKNSYATAINNLAQVVGFSDPGDGLLTHAFLWDNGSMQDLGNLGENPSKAFGINDSVKIVGNSFVTINPTVNHAFLWSNGSMQDLSTLGGLESNATCINNVGQIAGFSNPVSNTYHAFLWSNGSMQDLGALPSSNSSYSLALGINNLAQVVGYSDPSGKGSYLATLWRSGAVIDLNSFVLGTGWLLQKATGINDKGQIVGYGTINDQGRAYILTPPTFKNTLDDIRNYLQLGSIDNQGIAESLSRQIIAAATAAARGESRVSKNILEAFKQLVLAQTPRHIYPAAAQVLLEDANSLLSLRTPF